MPWHVQLEYVKGAPMTQPKSKGGPEDLLQFRLNRETVEEPSRVLLFFLVGVVIDLDDEKGGVADLRRKPTEQKKEETKWQISYRKP